MQKVDITKISPNGRGKYKKLMLRRPDLIADRIVDGDHSLWFRYITDNKYQNDLNTVKFFVFLKCVEYDGDGIAMGLWYHTSAEDLRLLLYQERTINKIKEWETNVRSRMNDISYLEHITSHFLLDYKTIKLISSFDRLRFVSRLAGDIVDRLYQTKNPRVLFWVSSICNSGLVEANYKKYLYNDNITSSLVSDVVRRLFIDHDIDEVIKLLYDDLIFDKVKFCIVYDIVNIVKINHCRIETLYNHEPIILDLADKMIRADYSVSVLPFLVPPNKEQAHEYARKMLAYIEEYEGEYIKIYNNIPSILSAIIVADAVVGTEDSMFSYFLAANKKLKIEMYDDLLVDLYNAIKYAIEAIYIRNGSNEEQNNMIAFIKYVADKIAKKENDKEEFKKFITKLKRYMKKRKQA